ncbi:N-acetyl-gamma-glutamyl-phosphate reductase [Candidatus Pelagibacter sp. HIMB1321]|uniref:N-acetyl-gamma-glutamyl-phosphate reductase n=1 Tax=Candidatus Pelagibacter sp. HIMB1321 TaxID=1388755 RepID=UPI000A07FDFC|nr:N-acetyl-gamma-glutamyl-phosphate reductase [Candidatus Pelagibacter sp. HIMB1321]SMF75542.1 N-acetyl-gamma-glutamyl-phosphate reductase [Candidatus Pelagibacter sp. HIMB1321]
MPKLNVLIAGSTGYIGIQLIKLLVKHPNVNIKYICGNSSVGKSITVYEKSLKKFKLPKIVKFNKKLIDQIDIVFTALPNGEAQIISKVLNKKTVLIDLAADFRLEKGSEYLKWYKLKHKAIHNIKKSIYALPEITGNKVKDFSIIACPGCYPTSIILPLLPLIKKNLIKSNNIIIDSKSGFSGAGRSVHKKYRNKNLYESLSVYGISSHRHNSEIEQILKKYTGKDLEFTFTPHLTPMLRGILSTIYVDLNKSSSISKLNYELKRFYKDHPFVKVKDQNTMLSTNDVIGSNNCFISVCKTKEKNKAIIISVLDNLIKGGAGQAVQNLNIKYNFPISRGLV